MLHELIHFRFEVLSCQVNATPCYSCCYSSSCKHHAVVTLLLLFLLALLSSLCLAVLELLVPFP